MPFAIGFLLGGDLSKGRKNMGQPLDEESSRSLRPLLADSVTVVTHDLEVDDVGGGVLPASVDVGDQAAAQFLAFLLGWLQPELPPSLAQPNLDLLTVDGHECRALVVLADADVTALAVEQLEERPHDGQRAAHVGPANGDVECARA